MEVSDARRLKELERENNQLKRLVAERDLAIEVMKAGQLDSFLPEELRKTAG